MLLGRRNTSGFTIVELLIVIVVIAILATISIVAYQGIQERAENTKTTAAVVQWVKAIRMYEADKGSWPTANSCLGDTDTYTGSYSGRCWPGETSGWVVSSSFLSQLQPYISSRPEPSSKNIGDDTSQYRGAMFYRATATDMRIYVEYIGSSATCPDISGLGSATLGSAVHQNGRTCYYRLAGP